MFKKARFILGVLVLGLFLLTTNLVFASPSGIANQATNVTGKVVVANRISGTISVIDVSADQVVNTIDLPGPNPPEPMYVSYSSVGNQVFVGDRANNQIVAYDADTFSLLGTVPAGAGVFHMWANSSGSQLWVNNDVDNTITVIDVQSLSVIETIPLPEDLVALGGKPHDVILSPNGKDAFVSVIGVAGANDYVLKFSAQTFLEEARAAVGKDPHLAVARQKNQLYVPTQNANQVTVLTRNDLSVVTDIPASAAHGAGMRPDGEYFYTTNISGGGPGGLITIDIKGKNMNTVVDTTDTPFPTPHNIALSPNGEKIYVTHSGATADKVSIYTTSSGNPVPVPVGDVTVGLNPFGLAYVP